MAQDQHHRRDKKGFSLQIDLNKLKNAASAAPTQPESTPPPAAPPVREADVGDSLDTARMPKPKPPSVNLSEFMLSESEKNGDGAYASNAEREFDENYAGNADMTVRDLLHRYLDKFWVRLGAGLLALLLAAFLVYQLYLRFYTSIKAETVRITTYSETIDVEGTAFRSEIAIGGSVSGAAVAAVRNGEKVLKGQPVIHLFHSAAEAEAYERIGEIERQITELEGMVTASEDSANAVRNIENMLSEQMTQLAILDGKTDMSALAECRSEIAYLLSKRLVAMRKVENYQERIDALTAEKTSLAASYSQAPATVNAPSAGYYVNSLDGYEEALDPALLSTMTAKQLKNILTEKHTPSSSNTGKLLRDFTWYLACPVPATEAKDTLAIKSSYTLLLPYSKTGSMQAQLVYLNEDENDANTVLAVFKCTSLVSELCDIRTQPVKIQIRSFTGFKIPKSAQHVHIGTKDETDEDGNVLYTYEERYPCVYAVVGHQLYSRRIDVLYKGDDFLICSASSEPGSGGLLLYDEIITEGKNLYAGKIIE